MQQGTLNPAAFSSWIEPLKPFKKDESSFTLVAKSDHVRATVNSRYASKIAGAFRAVFGKEYKIYVLLENEAKSGESRGVAPKAPNTKGTNLRPKFLFDNFVAGKCNEFAYSAALAVAENPGSVYNPLFIHGDVGLGKTHLMHAIGNSVLYDNPNAKILYTSSENLVNEFVFAIRNKKNEDFRRKYRMVDVLLIDDIQFLSEKDGIQEEFFHTFNALRDDDKHIVLTSDKHPSELKSIEDRLRSRFNHGLIVDISTPDLETRTAILLKKAEVEGVHIDYKVVDYIAKNIQSNIRELEGAFNAVTAKSKLIGKVCDLSLAEETLQDLLKKRERREVDVTYIQEVVSGYYGVTLEDLLSRRRTSEITYARHVAMYLCRMIIDRPLKTVGKDFGGKDHSTVIHAVDKITALLDRDKNLKKEVAELEKRLKVD